MVQQLVDWSTKQQYNFIQGRKWSQASAENLQLYVDSKGLLEKTVEVCRKGQQYTHRSSTQAKFASHKVRSKESSLSSNKDIKGPAAV